MKKIKFLTPTAEKGASSRYRVYQYVEYLTDIFECEIYPFMSDTTYTNFKNGSMIFVILTLPFLILKRIFVIFFKIHKNDIVFLHRDILPFGPMILEKILKLKGAKLIFDLDDAIYSTEIDEISNKKNRFMYNLKYGKRFDTTIKISDLVICGNEFLLDHCEKINKNCILIPTTVDTNKIKPKNCFNKDINNITVGWIGNPGNTKYVTNILNELDRFAQKKHIRIKLNMIGARDFDSSMYKNLDIRFLEWSLETEYRNLRECDVGIMPLNDSEWSKGKCGLKLLQYMAVGMIVVANDVGCNKDIVVDGKNRIFSIKKYDLGRSF